MAYILLKARECSTCGERYFLSWGGGMPTDGGLFTAEDAVPFRVITSDGNMMLLYKQGLFNDYESEFPAWTIHKMLCKWYTGSSGLQDQISDEFSSLFPLFYRCAEDVPTEQEQKRITEIALVHYELRRVYEAYASRYELGTSYHLHVEQEVPDEDEPTEPILDILQEEAPDQEGFLDGIEFLDDEGQTTPSIVEDGFLHDDMDLEEVSIGVCIDFVPEEELADLSLSEPSIVEEMVNDAEKEKEALSFFEKHWTKDEVSDLCLHWGGALDKGTSFTNALKKAYQLTQEFFSEKYNATNFYHRGSCLLQTVMAFFYTADVDKKSDDYFFSLRGGNTVLKICSESHLKLDGSILSILNQDLENVSSHIYERIGECQAVSISPLTPVPCDLSLLYKFVQALKLMCYDKMASLFNSICYSYGEFEKKEEMPHVDLKELCPLAISDCTLAEIDALNLYFSSLLEKLVSNIETTKENLMPSSRYHFSQTARFANLSHEVPLFLASQGNYAHILCQKYEPVEPQLHDGNCGVNAILIGLKLLSNGRFEFQYLMNHVGKLRQKIVKHAQQKRSFFTAQFGEDAVESCIKEFDITTHVEYLNEVSLAVAADLGGVVIEVYDRYKNYLIETTSDGFVEPAAIFRPENYVEKSSIIRLFRYEATHYCALLKRAGEE
jgi:hypothetical protein